MAEPMYECPSGWETCTLSPNREQDFITACDSGGTPRTSVDDYWNGMIPWLTPKEITRNNDRIFVSHTERSISQRGVDRSAAKVLAVGTVMLTKRAPVGAVAINSVPMCTNQGFMNFRCGSRLRPLFLAHWLRSNTEYLQQVANGSTYRELYKTDLFEFEVAVPPIEVQDQIIQAISSLTFLNLLGPAMEQSVSDPSRMLDIQDQDRRLRLFMRRLTRELLSGRMSPQLRSLSSVGVLV